MGDDDTTPDGRIDDSLDEEPLPASLTDGDEPLAAVVAKPRAETAIAELRAEGVYDEDRRVTDAGSDCVALPVTAPPTDTAVREIVRQRDPAYRGSDLATLLRERGWDDDAVDRAPGSWAVIGSVVVVRLDGFTDDQERDVGEALLDLHGEADTVLAREGVVGRTRDPRTRVVAGTGDTETVHTEHGTRYALDLSQVMFSPGNKAERVRMGEVVEADEHVFDMFAGIGYFTLPMARAGAAVSAAEIDPTACRYLVENAALNDVGDRVHAYRSDCREVAPLLDVDRVVMGYYGYQDEDAAASDGGDVDGGDDSPADRHDEAHEFLDAAFAALRPGGVVHYHEATPESRLWDRPESRLREAAVEVGRTVEVLERTVVKSHSEGVKHVVVDARVD